MTCPGCHADAISPGAKLRIALRAQVRCPVCSVQVRFSTWPRLLHTLVGDLPVVGGFVASMTLGTPAPLALSMGWWLALSLALPTEAGTKREP